jgi:hypothetical protein
MWRRTVQVCVKDESERTWKEPAVAYFMMTGYPCRDWGKTRKTAIMTACLRSEMEHGTSRKRSRMLATRQCDAQVCDEDEWKVRDKCTWIWLKHLLWGYTHLKAPGEGQYFEIAAIWSVLFVFCRTEITTEIQKVGKVHRATRKTLNLRSTCR